MEEKSKLNKNEIALVTCLYVIVIIIVVLLVLSISNQKKVVKESLTSYNVVEEYDV